MTPEAKEYGRLKYRFAKKERVLALGVFDNVSLADARRARDDAKRLLKTGQDPVAFKKQQRVAAEIAASNTFEAITHEWLDQQRNR